MFTFKPKTNTLKMKQEHNESISSFYGFFGFPVFIVFTRENSGLPMLTLKYPQIQYKNMSLSNFRRSNEMHYMVKSYQIMIHGVFIPNKQKTQHYTGAITRTNSSHLRIYSM